MHYFFLRQFYDHFCKKTLELIINLFPYYNNTFRAKKTGLNFKNKSLLMQKNSFPNFICISV